MAVKKSVKKSDKMLPIAFVNWELSKEQKEEAKRYEFPPDRVFAALDQLVDDGFRISWKRDDFHKCYNFSLTEPSEDGRETVRCIVSRGPTTLDAARIGCFKHFVLLDGDWGNLSTATVDEDVWG